MEFLTDPLIMSRLQFAATALYHFLFVPLTLGLVWLLVVLEATYVITKNPVWKQATQFWGKLFGINFAMGVATGITMEFQFGTNWAYYSHYVGDIFGTPLAIEGLMAFFLESTMIGLFFFGWKKLSRVEHLVVTCMLALGTNLSGLWILIANGWMQYPAGAIFNPDTMRMEMASFTEVFLNPVAQAKFVHTLSAGYVCGSMFMLGIASYFLLRRQHLEVMTRSFSVAAIFGLIGATSVVILGDESGYGVNMHQPLKMAAIEAAWETEPAPAGFTVFALPNQQEMRNDYEVKIPYVLGLIATRSTDKEVLGVKDIIADAQQRMQSGIIAYDALHQVRQNPQNEQAKALLDQHGKDLGYGLLLKAKGIEPTAATPQQIAEVSQQMVPKVAPLFFSFRIMVALGAWFILLFAAAVWYAHKRNFAPNWVQKAALYSIPLPWVAIELGWIVAEYGRQPWAIQDVLPTGMAASATSGALVLTSFFAFVLFYTTLLIIDVRLMFKYAKKGPAPLESIQ